MVKEIVKLFLLTIFAVSLFVGCSNNIKINDFASKKGYVKNISYEKKVDAINCEKLKINANISDVEVKTVKGNSINIAVFNEVEGKNEEVVEKMLRNMDYRIKKEGDIIEINSISDNQPEGIYSITGKLKLSIPEKLLAIDVTTKIGDINIDTTLEKINVETKIGSINASLEKAKETKLVSDTGDIKVKGQSEKVDISTKVGNINLDIEKLVNANVKSKIGDISVHLRTISYDGQYMFESKTGFMKIKIPKNTKVSINGMQKAHMRLDDVKLDANGVKLYIKPPSAGDVVIQGY